MRTKQLARSGSNAQFRRHATALLAPKQQRKVGLLNTRSSAARAHEVAAAQISTKELQREIDAFISYGERKMASTRQSVPIIEEIEDAPPAQRDKVPWTQVQQTLLDGIPKDFTKLELPDRHVVEMRLLFVNVDNASERLVASRTFGDTDAATVHAYNGRVVIGKDGKWKMSN